MEQLDMKFWIIRSRLWWSKMYKRGSKNWQFDKLVKLHYKQRLLTSSYCNKKISRVPWEFVAQTEVTKLYCSECIQHQPVKMPPTMAQIPVRKCAKDLQRVNNQHNCTSWSLLSLRLNHPHNNFYTLHPIVCDTAELSAATCATFPWSCDHCTILQKWHLQAWAQEKNFSEQKFSRISGHTSGHTMQT